MHYCDGIIMAARRWGHSYMKLPIRSIEESKTAGLGLNTSGQDVAFYLTAFELHFRVFR